MPKDTYIIAATTIDGYIGRDADHTSTQWTSKEDAKFFRSETKKAGLLIMGRTTYATVGRPLPDRTTIVLTSQPDLISNAKQLTKDTDPTQLYTGKTELFSTSMNIIDLHQVLQKSSAASIAICGGASVYQQYLEKQLVDRLLLTTEAVVFGTGIPLFGKKLNATLERKQTINLSTQTIVSEYFVRK